MANEPVPDFFTPSFFLLGPDGNVSSIQSSDYLPNTASQDGQGFKLFDSTVVHDFLTRGGIDAGDAAFTDLYVTRALNNAGSNASAFFRVLFLQNNPATDGGDLSIDRRSNRFWLLTPSAVAPPGGFTESWTATGPPLAAESLVTTAAYAGAAYAQLAPLVQVGIPAGIFDVEVESYHIGGAAAAFSATSWSGPGVVASDTNGAVPTLVANQRLHQTRRRDNLQFNAAGTITMEFRSPSAVAITWGARALRVYPRVIFL